MNWRTELRPIDIADPTTGETLYVWAAIRPVWYWWLSRVGLFLSIVWRVYDVRPDGSNYRLSIATSWSVSEVAMGPTS
jgi:hypothetical protein